jgi:hypothetical protein
MVILMNGRCALVASKLQAVVATYTAEAQDIAGGLAVKRHCGCGNCRGASQDVI